METVQVSLSKSVVDEATVYAHNNGISLSAMIENYLLHVTHQTKPLTPKKEKVVLRGVEIPEVVLSLMGAGEPVEDDDINGRKAYYSYLEEKYK
ncbi:MAG: DUF6364 family protein [Prevotellaceae bacterium]|jgi:hypothetical protein|nr:DUF6364 family protein [Prevotellaceae bacterium]